MSQFNAPVRRTGGSLDVYTGLLAVAFLVLAAGVTLMALRNLEHSSTSESANDGGVITLLPESGPGGRAR